MISRSCPEWQLRNIRSIKRTCFAIVSLFRSFVSLRFVAVVVVVFFKSLL